ncbi:hypothetical protein K458DRAFT_390614 [Lentithecium fluviatile CBS 122367]|uniref:Diels-Alderase N-terminal domain-containing protein n=1 Tax=Lentithecium fluviatile CBS 122367 TaxID=1168545 RepID=A0A6G1IWR9_9PLEO|nr:hypothetical protein K458DRAFT_390614 [Lentithecium fluviatile CBS 122367]
MPSANQTSSLVSSGSIVAEPGPETDFFPNSGNLYPKYADKFPRTAVEVWLFDALAPDGSDAFTVSFLRDSMAAPAGFWVIGRYQNTGNVKPLIKCFISIGTGHPGIRSVSDKGLKSLVETLEKVATKTEATNQQFEGRWRGYIYSPVPRCFRFNVTNGLESVRLAEFDEEDLIRAATLSYMKERNTMSKVTACVENLRQKEHRPTLELVQKIKDEALEEETPRPTQVSPKATPAEIAELIDLGNSQLKISSDRRTRNSLEKAFHYFSKTLFYLKNDPKASPKQVSRVCQKLMETEIGLSMITQNSTKRKKHAHQAREYGEVALENVTKCADECMVAQMEFLLACVTAWEMYLQSEVDGQDHQVTENVQVLLETRLNRLRRFQELKIEFYEEQMKTYLGYLQASGRV